MPRPCSVCVHPKRAEIEAAILNRDAFRSMATRFGTSTAALTRHKQGHLPIRVAKAAEAREVAIADDLLQQLRALRNRAISLLQQAEQAGDIRTALQGVREARACVEVLMEVEGELDRRGVVSVTIAPEWVSIRTVMLTTLADHPEARIAVASALQSIEGGNVHAGD